MKIKIISRNASIAFLFVGLIALQGCRREQHFQWEEEVKQMDGKILKVIRKQKRYSNNYPISSGTRVISQELHYPSLGVLWKSVNVERPMSFSVIDNVAYLVVSVPMRDDFCANHPKGSIIANFYRWTNGQFEVINEQAAPVDKMLANLSNIGPYSLRVIPLRKYVTSFPISCK